MARCSVVVGFVFVLYFLIWAVTVLVTAKRLENSVRGVLHTVAFSGCGVTSLWLYVKAVVRSPGNVPHDFVPDPEASEVKARVVAHFC